MLELTDGSKEKLLKWNAGEGIIFIKAKDNSITGLNIHIGKDGKVYFGSEELKFKVEKYL